MSNVDDEWKEKCKNIEYPHSYECEEKTVINV